MRVQFHIYARRKLNRIELIFGIDDRGYQKSSKSPKCLRVKAISGTMEFCPVANSSLLDAGVSFNIQSFDAGAVAGFSFGGPNSQGPKGTPPKNQKLG